ncbi:MAG: GrrA/OscA1 family cyclophane-containing rSAM-modified RiPP [Microcystaceae cyanobacterium]
MKITSQMGLVGFLLVLSALSPTKAEAHVQQATTDTIPATLEERLARITETLRQRENQLQEPSQQKSGQLYARGAWGNGRGRGWVNGRRGRGWGDGRRGGWGNGWRDGGGFANFRW